jgi:hypothetical protein
MLERRTGCIQISREKRNCRLRVVGHVTFSEVLPPLSSLYPLYIEINGAEQETN